MKTKHRYFCKVHIREFIRDLTGENVYNVKLTEVKPKVKCHAKECVELSRFRVIEKIELVQ